MEHGQEIVLHLGFREDQEYNPLGFRHFPQNKRIGYVYEQYKSLEPIVL